MTTPVTDIEQAVFADCVLVLADKLRVDDPVAMAARGYHSISSDEEGMWASKAIGEGRIRIGVEAGKPGCRARYDGIDAVAIYESVLHRVQKRGFAFVGGKRKTAENRFVLDTLARQNAEIGIISMFRLADPAAAGFAITVYPPAS